jgi:hypothetical protein
MNINVVFKVKFYETHISDLQIILGELHYSVMQNIEHRAVCAKQLNIRDMSHAVSQLPRLLHHAGLLTFVGDDSQSDDECDTKKKRRGQ